MTLSGGVIKAHTVPLLFEPGQGWVYGGGIDWASLSVSRVNNVTLEEYLQKNIFAPLGLTSMTFRLERHPEIQERLVKTAERTEDGTLKPTITPWPDYASEDCGGAGFYSSAEDYVKILGDLIKNNPPLLKRDTVEKEMFASLLPRGSATRIGLLASSDTVTEMTGATDVPVGFNWGLGGMYLEEVVGWFKAGTLAWGGYSDLTWCMHRGKGLAGLYASQVIPPGDPKSVEFVQNWIEEVWRVSERV